MKKLLLSVLITFGSAQLFIRCVTLFTGTNSLPPHPSPSTSDINRNLPVKLKEPAGTIDKVMKFETGIKNSFTMHDLNFTVLPYNIAKISGMRLFYNPDMTLESFSPFSAYNWRWRLVE